MKKIRSIQFKVFICLFISFMVVFGYVVKDKYDRSFNELVYNTDYSGLQMIILIIVQLLLDSRWTSSSRIRFRKNKKRIR